MASPVFDLFAKLSLDSSAYESGLNKAKGLASSVGSGLANGFKKLMGISTAAIGAVTAAGTAFAKSAVQTGLSFDAAMGEVAATAGKTAEELAAMTGTVDTSFGEFTGTLREFALFMGKNTAFSATEAAQALNYMALAGYSTQESMEMLPTVLNMAAAGSMDLARASDMITDTQSALGLSFERTSLMVDEFAKAASTGNTSVEQLGDAFLTVGGLARELNGGFVTLANGEEVAVDGVEELEIAFTAMANAGIKGSEAGTHMRNILLKLSNPTKDGTEALKQMGVAIYDDAGQMRSLNDIFTDLNKSLGQMSQAKKLSVISDLFNARDTASAEALLSAVQQDWDAIGSSILDAQGAASQMADTKLDNLQGQLTIMKSALEGAKIALSDKLTPSLKELVKYGTNAISELTTAFEEGGFTGAMEKFGEILSDGLQKGIAKLPQVTEIARKLLSTLGKGILDNLDVVSEAASSVMTQIASFVLSGLPGLIEVVASIFGKIGTWIEDNAGFILTSLENAWVKLIEFIENNAGTVVNGILKLIKKVVQRAPNFIKPLLKAMPKIIKDVAKAIGDNAPEIIQGIVDLVFMICEELPTIITAIIEVLPDLIRKIATALVDNLPELIAGIILMVEGIIEKLPEIMAGIAGAVWDVLLDIIASLTPFGEDFKKWFEDFDFGGFIGGVFGEALEIAKGIFSFFATLMDDPGQALKDAFDGIKNYAVKVFESVKTIITGIFDLIKAKKAEAEAEERMLKVRDQEEKAILEGKAQIVEGSKYSDEFYDALEAKKAIYGENFGTVDYLTHNGDNSYRQLEVSGTITHKGVNNEGELVASIEEVNEQLAEAMAQQDRMGG